MNTPRHKVSKEMCSAAGRALERVGVEPSQGKAYSKVCEVEAVRASLEADVARDAKASTQAAVTGFKPPWIALRDHGSFEEYS